MPTIAGMRGLPLKWSAAGTSSFVDGELRVFAGSLQTGPRVSLPCAG
jgi:hypothetical protein